MAKKKHHISGADIIIEALREEQVTHVFGYPGGAVLHIYDAIYKQKDIKITFSGMIETNPRVL